MDTWGGYVRGAEIKPAPGRNRRDEDPNWRGKFSGGSRSVRVKAQFILNVEELQGHVGDDPDRAALVAQTLEARGQLKDTRDRKKIRIADAKQAAVDADPFKWPCVRCVIENEEPDGSGGVLKLKRDLFNLSSAAVCWKCTHPRPDPDSAESVRWKCPECSTDEYTLSGAYPTCPDCGRDYNEEEDEWWLVRFPRLG